MKRLLFALAALMCAALILPGCSRGEGFAIYLTRDNIRPADMVGASLDGVALAESPIIATSDIVDYDSFIHEIELTPAAYQRVAEMQVPTYGVSFVVCVDKKPIYWGAFWTLVSSASFDGVTIWVAPVMSDKENTMAMELGYPAPSFYSGQDPRADARIFSALRAAGKLTE